MSYMDNLSVFVSISHEVEDLVERNRRKVIVRWKQQTEGRPSISTKSSDGLIIAIPSMSD